MRPTTILKIASNAGRNYITPEDVQRSLNSGRDRNLVRLELLKIIGCKLMGVEDQSLCAFVAFKGKKESGAEGVVGG